MYIVYRLASTAEACLATSSNALSLSPCPHTQGEHGTPLHEAALFGKADTVRMLLDKGAKVEAKDRASKTVLEALRDFPAEKAKEITKMIEGMYQDVLMYTRRNVVLKYTLET